MNDDESTTTASPANCGRGKSFVLYVAAAVVFALCMYLISIIPGYEGGGRAIHYQSFGPLCVATIGLYLLDSNGGLLRHVPLPDWFGYGAFILIAALYSLLIVLPIYFYFRTHRTWLLGIQTLALIGHAVFALRVVAQFWIGM
jgi:hypothetical protein